MPQLLLLLNALLLGFRHGIDWDHIAAIVDIVGTSTTSEGVLGDALAGKPIARPQFVSKAQLNAVFLSSFYVIGHSLVVIALGLAAMFFAATLPEWIDPIMERVVGWTLIIFGLWVAALLIDSLRGRREFKLQSRWMVVFAAIGEAFRWLRRKIGGTQHEHEHKVLPAEYGPKAALLVGMIHGIGAETGTQVLLITAVSGAQNYALGVGLLFAFTLGFAVSNTIVAMVSAGGFLSAAKLKPLYAMTGAGTAILSVVVGIYFAVGQGSHLPDLQRVFGGAH